MVRYVPDKTRGLGQRPHYDPKELDLESEKIITEFLKELYGEVRFPVTTEDLKKLIERDADDLDCYADLSAYGADVEGLTEFTVGKKPEVKISKQLTEDEYRANRLRTTLTHEYGHVRFHAYLWELQSMQQPLFQEKPKPEQIICKRETILNAPQSDWMEWQAGYVCGAILMPASFVTELVSRYRQEHKLCSSVIEGATEAKELLSEVQTAFEVSADAARVRLLKLGLLVSGRCPEAMFS